MKKLLVLALVGLLVAAGSGLTYSFDWLDGVQPYQFEGPAWGFGSQTYGGECSICPPPPPPPCPPPTPPDSGIDIKYGSDPNSINLNSKGVVPVTVFDTGTLDPSTVEFAGAEPIRWTMEDVDGDGTMDWLFHFKTQDLNLDMDSTEATLTGDTSDGEFEGMDTVNIVPKGKGKK